MSIRKEGQVIETLYVGVQPRRVPLEGETAAKGSVYNISVDKKEIFGAPIITLVVGNTYRFVIDTPGHPFYITTDPEGGAVSRPEKLSLLGAIEVPIESSESKGNVGIEKGVLVFSPKAEHAQMELYYQCNYHKKMGNKVNVIIPPHTG